MPAFDAASDVHVTGASNPLTLAHTVAAQLQNRILFLFVLVRGNPGTSLGSTSVQYDGQSPTGQLTDVSTSRFGNNFGLIQCFYWLEPVLPNNGSPTAHNFTAVNGVNVFGTSYVGVSVTAGSQVTPAQGTNSQNSDSTSSTVGVTTTQPNQMVMDVVGVWTSVVTTGVAPTAGQTERVDHEFSTGDRLAVGTEIVPSPGLETQTWDFEGNANYWMMMALVINDQPVIAGSNPQPDSSTSGNVSGGSALLSESLTIAAQGQSRLLLAWYHGVGFNQGQTKATNVSYDGTPPDGQLTPDIEVSEAGIAMSLQVYYWLEASLPSNGTPTAHSLNATSQAGALDLTLLAMSQTLAKQETPIAIGRNSTLSNNSASTVNIVTLEANSLIDDVLALWSQSAISNADPQSGQTKVEQLTFGPSNFTAGGYEEVGAAGSFDQDWSWTTLGNLWMAFAVAMAPIAVGQQPPGIVPGNVANGDAGTPFSHTLTGAQGRGVIIMTSVESQAFASAVTHNGVPATFVTSGQSTDSAGNTTEMWVAFPADGLAAGPYTIDVTHAGGSAVGVSVVEINNILQVVPTGVLIDDDDSAPITTISTFTTAPGILSIGVGHASHGGDGNAWDATPGGTGTWIRLFTESEPPTSALTVGAYQQLSGAGAVTYTEDTGVSANRGSMVQAIFQAVPVILVSTFFDEDF